MPMAMGAALKLRRIVQNVRHVLAIELLCAARGLDLPRAAASGAGACARCMRRCGAMVAAARRRPVARAGHRTASADAIAAGRFVPDTSVNITPLLTDLAT